jgi:hypothetical protein
MSEHIIWLGHVPALYLQVDYIDVPKRTLMTVPGYSEPVEFGVLTSFA